VEKLENTLKNNYMIFKISINDQYRTFTYVVPLPNDCSIHTIATAIYETFGMESKEPLQKEDIDIVVHTDRPVERVIHVGEYPYPNRYRTESQFFPLRVTRNMSLDEISDLVKKKVASSWGTLSAGEVCGIPHTSFTVHV
jgi:hypothetical protein